MVLQLNTPRSFVGLNTFTFTIPSNGPYFVQVSAKFPAAVARGTGAGSNPSGSPTAAFTDNVQYTIKQNGSTIYTSPALPPKDPSPVQSFKVPMNCAATDTIEVDMALTSGTPIELNAIETVIMIGQ